MVSALNKLLLTRLRDRNAAVRVEEGRVRQIDFAPSQAEEEVGAVYVGKVRNIVKNIQAAFVEYRPGVNGFYSLAENRRHLYTDGREHSVLKAGDEILVQVSRAAVKTKDAVLTSRISLTGVYAVYIAGTEKRSAQLNISKKITDASWREAADTWWEKQELTDCEVILRTNAAQADFSWWKRRSVRCPKLPKNAGTCAQPGPFQRPIPSGIVFPAGSKGHPSKRGMGNCIRSTRDHDGA